LREAENAVLLAAMSLSRFSLGLSAVGGALLGLALTASCGDAVDTTPFGAGGAGGGGGSDYSLDTVCAAIAPQVCAQREGCCTASGLGYAEAGCEAYERAGCEANVAEVEAGTMTFDPTHIDACLTALQPWVDQCALTAMDRVEMLDTYRLCSTVFVGEVPIGQPCERDGQCAPAADANEFVTCSAQGSCELFTVLGQGDPCEMGQGANRRAICGTGLFCDAALGVGQPPFAGTCQPATPLGAACDIAAQPFSLECGLGFYCDVVDTGTCIEAKDAGESCTTPLECKSLDCPQPGNQCSAVEVMLSAEQCHGTA
jgi:hypothetical protein